MKQIGERTTKKYSLRFKESDWVVEWIQSDPYWKYPDEDWNIYLGEELVSGIKNDYVAPVRFGKLIDELIEHFFDQIKQSQKK